jgi:hypothetical protein
MIGTDVGHIAGMIRRLYRAIHNICPRCGILDRHSSGLCRGLHIFYCYTEGAVAILTQHVERNDLTAKFCVKMGE